VSKGLILPQGTPIASHGYCRFLEWDWTMVTEGFCPLTEGGQILKHTTLTALILSVILLTIQPAVAKWTTFSSPEGKFKASFPTTPAKSTETNTSPVGDIESQTFASSANQLDFSVTYTDLPELALLFGGEDKILRDTKTRLLEKVSGREVSWKDVSVNGYQGKELKYTVDDGRKIGRARMFISGDRLYVLNATGPRSNKAEMERFWNSFSHG